MKNLSYHLPIIKGGGTKNLPRKKRIILLDGKKNDKNNKKYICFQLQIATCAIFPF